ncbi:hypothetical protein K4F52_002347 [Lecanicillium sp. MT-2017a]|nr:hypothetical protein K4F52_002347 [Lecanicillium sp. MT-2017a]
MVAAEDETPQYDIGGWDTGDDDFDISIRRNGFRFRIPVSPACFVNSPTSLAIFHDIFERLSVGEDDAPEVWDYTEVVADAFLSAFQRLAPPLCHEEKLTLADLAIRRIFRYEYSVMDEKAVAGTVVPCPVDTTGFKDWDMYIIQSQFPLFSLAEVEVPYTKGEAIHNIIPQHVRVQDKIYCYKSCLSPYDAVDEAQKYAKLAVGARWQHVLVSQLVGIVADKAGQTQGLLYNWIDTKEGITLTSCISTDTPILLREKWAHQICHTLSWLHEVGVAWGDVKADNILIDKDDNAIIIGLEGGTTKGWVDSDIGGTMEGDLQGMERLRDFIFNDDSALRTSDDDVNDST